MCVIYVDDTIFASANVSEIDSEIHALGIASNEQRHTFSLRNEGQVNAFLGIQIQQISPNEFELTQTGLIDKVLAATNLTNCNGCETPTLMDPLHIEKRLAQVKSQEPCAHRRSCGIDFFKETPLCFTATNRLK